jgi:ssRNA-specific RNase YbeY (16S rRNA maturation enzyme)
MEDEVLRYAIHGLLHLIGYLDDTPDQRKHMNALESRYLAGKQDERRPSEGRP